eukprot:CAMPEP_0114242870 /NCGR_PEP_ID=MMETSP0058-20121206/10434_1 /TAXON_ID=36894 /ORGANISM="Pyramimonas parkeae, CCMP726" /LENGTH=335 /DNA_ID=CAMNT_0001355567 /DNA_START=65 /DNA_END=1072 /DNA_ORIENTATION=-
MATIKMINARPNISYVSSITAKNSRPALLGRQTRLCVTNNVKLVSIKSSEQFEEAGAITFEFSDVLFKKRTLVVGANTSAGSGVDILLPASTVAGTHAELTASADYVMVKDLGSASGTYVNGTKVAGEAKAELGNVISFDADKGIGFVVDLDSEAPDLTPEEAAAKSANSMEGWTSEGVLEERIKDRAAWIDNFRSNTTTITQKTSESAVDDSWAKSFPPLPPAKKTYPQPIGWAKRYPPKPVKAKMFTKPVPGFASEAGLESRIKDRAQWISNHRTKSSAKPTADLEMKTEWAKQYPPLPPAKKMYPRGKTWAEKYRPLPPQKKMYEVPKLASA